MEKHNIKTFLIDFDNTCTCEDFPNVGMDVPYAIPALKLIQEAGHKIILWTCRNKKPLEDAIKWFKNNGIILTAINDFSDEQKQSSTAKIYGPTRKVIADYIIDDKNLGCPMKHVTNPKTGKIYNCVDWLKIVDILESKNLIKFNFNN